MRGLESVQAFIFGETLTVIGVLQSLARFGVRDFHGEGEALLEGHLSVEQRDGLGCREPELREHGFAVVHLTAKSDILMRRLDAVLKAVRSDPDLSPRPKKLSLMANFGCQVTRPFTCTCIRQNQVRGVDGNGACLIT